MAQKRFLSRRVTESDKILALKTDLARFLYCALLTHADSSGRVNANPAGLKHSTFEAFPWTEAQIAEAVDDLGRVGLVRLYSTPRHKLLMQFEQFDKFNKPHTKEAPSDFPGPDDPGATARKFPVGNAAKPTPATLPVSFPEKSGLVEGEGKWREEEPPYSPPKGNAAQAPPSVEPKPKKSGSLKAPPIDPLLTELPEYVPRDSWARYCQMRKEKGSRVTSTIADAVLAKLAKTPDLAARLLDTATERGWTGLEVKWLRLDQDPPAQPDRPWRPLDIAQRTSDFLTAEVVELRDEYTAVMDSGEVWDLRECMRCTN